MKTPYLSLAPFVSWKKERHPIGWSRKFKRDVDIEVEIGFGLGDYLVHQARENPKKAFIGIEVGWVLVRRALRKIALAGIKNVRIIQADASVVFERLFSEKSVRHAWSLCPCPWPKKKHVKRRLFSQAFFKLLNSRIMDDGEVLIVTDHQPYFYWVLSQLSGTGFEAHSRIVPPRFFTKYERKWHDSGQQQFYEMRLIKRQHVKIPVKEDAALITHRVNHFDPARFRPVNNRGRIFIEFKDTIHDPEQLRSMVRVVAGEDNIIQDFWIELVRMEDGWHIRPAKGCSIVPTAGVQRALDLVRDAVDM